MDNSTKKPAIYKNGAHTKILGYSGSNIRRVKTIMNVNKSNNIIKFKNNNHNNKNKDSIKSPPHTKPFLNSENKSHCFTIKMKDRRVFSPIINFNNKKNVQKSSTPTNGKIIYNEYQNKQKNNNKREFEANVKMIFNFLISTIYLSLYFLCSKILFGTPMPYIPPIGTSLFIISFNNVILSAIFIIIDQIDYLEYLYFEKIANNFLKMIFNFSVILFTIKSLENMKLLSFIILINMKPIIISFLNIRESNKSHSYMDIFCYFLFGLICITEFFIENKISIIFTFILIIIDTFDSFAKLNTNTLHPYLTTFGCSVIGISISPLIMVIRNDLLIISFSQYLLFLIISLAHFLSIYFLSKYIQYSFGIKFKILSTIIIYFIFIIYSLLLLRENNTWSTYFFFMFSLFINNYAVLRNDSTNIQ